MRGPDLDHGEIRTCCYHTSTWQRGHGAPLTGCSCVLYAHLSCLWMAFGWYGKAVMLKISARRDLANEETGHQQQGSWAGKQNSHFIPTLSWSCIPRDGPESPTAPIMISSRLDHLSWMGFPNIYFFHLLCFKWFNLINCKALGR